MSTLLRGSDPARSVLVEAGRIAALGADAVERGARRVVDVGDAVVVPAFRDGHVHPLWAGLSMRGARVGAASSIDEVLDAVRRHAVAHPGAAWVTGAGYDPSLLPGGVGEAAALDAAVRDRPVLLWATDHHAAWVNSAALRAAGIDDSTPDPEGGRIVRDERGRARGTLLEAAAHAVAALVPAPFFDDKVAALRQALALLVADGVVWAQEAAVTVEDAAVYRALAESDDLPCRVNLAYRTDPATWRDQVARLVDDRDRTSSLARRGLRAGTVKLFADGIVESGTAALLSPYQDDHASCGITLWPPEEMRAAAVELDRLGFQLHIHAIGDAAVRTALDTVEHVSGVNGPRDRRPVVAHCQLVDAADLPRFAALGVVANLEPLWAQQDRLMTDLTEPRLGAERSARQYPIASLVAAGAAVSFGSDWPVSSYRPLPGVAVAVTRQTSDGHPPSGWLPRERVSISTALHAYTAGVAYQAFEEATCGTMAVGQRADLCLLSADPRAVEPGDLASVDVLRTWSAGREVFST